MSYKKILFVDLLYSKNGSYDDDFEAIRAALPEVQCDYLKCDVRDGIGGVLRTLRGALHFHYAKVVFLSAKVSQLVLLMPLSLLRKTYAIYHFMPNSRARLHSHLLPVLSRRFRFATYADAVSDVFRSVVGQRPPALPSRIVEKAESERLLREKFAGDSALRVLIPGVRPGVRKFIDPQRLLVALQEATGVREIRMFIQGEPVDAYVDHPSIQFVGRGIPKEDYDALYRSCHVIAVEFDEGYEVRASGVILDAAASGCLVLTTDHAINRGYGFPNSILCDIERIGALIRRIRAGESLQGLVPGAGVKEFGQRWRTFLDI
jgi:hypothetical protein